MNRKYLALVVLVLALAAPPTALAFNAVGHKVVAAIAWRKLSPERRAEIVAVLREHPRFDEDFAEAMEDEVGDAPPEEQDRWIFCQAAVWPDIARGLPAGERGRYHRPRWHYINLPVFWDAAQAQAFAGGVSANLSFDFPTSLTPDKLNAVQAIKFSLAVVNSSQTTPQEKAVHYCWLIHVIADLHQPLHAAALFSVDLFPTGDKGGNGIEVREGPSGARKNLHSVWDALLGKSGGFNSILGRAMRAVEEFPADFDATFVGLPHDAWSTENQQAALASVYGPLLSEIAAAEANGEELDRITLSEDYLAAGGMVARRQAVIAGARMAGVLTSVSGGAAGLMAAGGPELHFPAAIASGPGADDASRLALGGAEAALARLSVLEAEVRALRQEVAVLRQAIGGGGLAAPALSGATLEVDDGEQCSCGAEEVAPE